MDYNPGLLAVSSFVLALTLGVRYYNKKQADERYANPPLDMNVIKRQYADDDLSFALYGDSIMRGSYSSDVSIQPTALLQAAIPGSTWFDGTMPGRRLLDLIPLISPVSFFKTKYTVIEHGVIDSWQGFDVIENYRKVIARIRAEGSIPIITGFSHQVVCATITPEHLQGRDRQNAALQNLAKELNVPFANLDMVPFYGADELLDGVHPKREYSDRLVAQIAETVKKAANLK